MAGPLSVIIPTLNAEAGLPGCLDALSDPLVSEVIVADGGSRDGTVALAARAGVRLVGPLPPSRGGQLRTGCAEATGAWLLIVHADTVLAPGWSDAVVRHMAEHPDRAGWFAFALDDPSPVARVWEAGVRVRSRLGWPYGDQGLLIPRCLYDAVGGYRDQPLMEDLDLVRRLGRSRLRGLGVRALTSAARYRTGGYAGRSLRNWDLVLRWLAGADPAELARRYRR
jgi:rSAM/selenodomain-associated transferase 2